MAGDAGGKTLTVGLLTEVGRLDPRQPPEFVATSILYQIFEPPYSLPVEERPAEPLLFAEPLAREAGPTETWSAPLRSGIEFSDGTPLTAADVARSIEASGALAGEARVTTRGDRVVFHLERPNARFHLTLTQVIFAPFRETAGGGVLGTGPFVLAPDSTSTSIRLLRNERYRTEVPLDEVRYRIYPVDADGRPESLLADLESGAVDLCYVLGRDEVSRLTKVRKHILPGSSTCFLYLNVERPAMAQVEVRRAIAHALDRSALAKLSYAAAAAFTAHGPLPPAMGTGRDGLGHDPKKARELLAQPGVRKPDRLTLLRVWGPRPYLPHPGPVTDAVVAALRDLDVAVDVVTAKSPADYFEHIARGDADLFLSGWVADTPDPAEFLESVLSSRAIPRPGHLSANGNLSRFSHPEMDAALQRYRADPDQERVQDVLRVLADEVPLVPLMYGAAIFVHAWRVRHFTPSPFGRATLAGVDIRD